MAIVDALWSMFGNKDEGNKAARVKATVLRRDEDGTVWVHIEGGVTETPVYSTTVDVAQGDVVTVRVEGGKAYIDGSNSDPGVGVRRMIQAVEPIAKDSKAAKALADAAGAASEVAQRIATEAQEAAQAVSQYFWQRSEDTQSDGAGTGAFVTEETQEDFLDAAGQGFPDLSDQHPHHNLLMNSLGIMLRTGLRNLVSITRSAIAFYDGLGNNAANVVASFGSDGAQVGNLGGQHVLIDSDGFSTRDGNTETAFIGNGSFDIGVSGKGGLSFNTSSGLVMRGESGHNVLRLLEGGLIDQSGNTHYGFVILNEDGYSQIRMNSNPSNPAYSDLDIHVMKSNINIKDTFRILTEGAVGTYSEVFYIQGKRTTAKYNLDVQGDGVTDATLTVANSHGGSGKIIVEDLRKLVISSSSIDFYYSQASSNYTSRIIEDASGQLTISQTGGSLRKIAAGYNNGMTVKANNQANNETVSSQTDSGGFIITDKNDAIMARTFHRHSTDGTCWFYFETHRKIGSTDYWNALRCGIDANGNSVWSVGGPANFRSAIGAIGTSGGTITAGALTLKSTNIDRDAANPSALQYSNSSLVFTDNNGEQIGGIDLGRETDGRIRITLYAANENTSGSNITNLIRLYIKRDGTATYSVTNAANFRSAIGAAASSDRRLKTDLKPLGDDAVEFVRALKSYSYIINGERQVGLIAQDVHEADTWGTRMAFETEDGVDGLDDWERLGDGIPTWKLDYIRLLPPTITALQKAMERIDALDRRIADLEGRI